MPALAGILVCSMLGGMRAVTWTQVAQYIVLIIAYLTPVVILSTQKYGVPVPELMYGQALQDITAREQEMIANGLAEAATLKPHVTAFLTYDRLNYFALILCLMVGTASLPHILMRYFTTPSVRDARKSVAWSLFFIFLLYFTAPSYAAFAKLEVYTNVIGQNLDALPAWISTYSQLDLVKIYGITLKGLGGGIAAVKAALAAGALDVASVAASLQAAGQDALLASWSALADPVKAVVFEAVKANPAAVASDIFTPSIHAAAQAAGNTTGLLTHGALAIDNDVIVLSTPEIAGMPYVIAGLVAAGGLAAALSTADGLLLAIANALSHDIYYKMVDTKAPTSRRLIVARILLGAGGDRCGLCGLHQAIGHSGDGVVGLLACGCGPLPGTGSRCLVETRQQVGCHNRHDRWALASASTISWAPATTRWVSTKCGADCRAPAMPPSPSSTN